MAEHLNDDAGLLHIHQLKSGLVQLTDSTNAMRLLKEHGRDIRYVAAWKKWVVWNGRQWELDEGGALVHEKGLEMVRNIYGELARNADYRMKLDIQKHAVLSESVRRREAFVKAAQWIKGLNIKCDDLDSNPWLLNVRNGTIDVLTGGFTEHCQSDMISKIANVEYDPEADCPLWKRFIREIMDYKTDLIAFLQRAAGWGITGDNSGQTMFIFYGSGANGKSTFLNAVMHLLGDYATSAMTETFMKQSGDRITNDIARLRGTRFVTAAEAEEGRRLSEPLIKQITGNDRMTARFLYSEFFTFQPTFKIYLATNHKPLIKGSDYGIWRRIKLIPFTTRIPEDRQDRQLEEKLRREASGILNWLLEGARSWRVQGLNAPVEILNATDEYRAEMDVIGNFIKECCVEREGLSIRVRELFKCYQDWCIERSEHGCSERFFTLRLKDMGYAQGRNSDSRFWNKLGLREGREYGKI